MLKDMLISDAADGDYDALEKLKELYPELGEVFATTIFFGELCDEKDDEIKRLDRIVKALQAELRDVAS